MFNRPPGSDATPDQVQRRLEKAWSERPTGYAPRTSHLQDAHTPRYINRLFLETSPYLRQHAHNPVDWFPWGQEAFDYARQTQRPILLSVGYATCHWCHVMEEESFEDEEIAHQINASYVPIKVDREERPDVDAIYMGAVQAMTGHGGWPMTVWLTPDAKPFFAGTYFPARDGDRGARYGFLTLLKEVATQYASGPERAAEMAERVTEAITLLLDPPAGAAGVPAVDEIFQQALTEYVQRYDGEYGGLRPPPKFPSSLPVRFLLRAHRRDRREQTLAMATHTLKAMARGGIYDHIGGGFHRYSTDAHWLVPHFEKMLYDNALLAMAYLEAHQIQPQEGFAAVARDVLDYVAREMTNPEGGFYSATDADSLTPNGKREEGWFFTWTPSEIDTLLEDERARLIKTYYNVTAQGNFEGRNILHVTRDLGDVARQLGISRERAQHVWSGAREQMRAARAKRPAPLLDDKCLAAWNGLMIQAFAKAARVLLEPAYAERAERAAAFVLDRMRSSGRLMRSYKQGEARHNGYLDDYAFMIAGLLELYQATGALQWLRAAIDMDSTLAELYEDKDRGGFFMTSHDHPQLIAREKPLYDGAEPSGNSLQAANLSHLQALTLNDAYRVRREKLMQWAAERLRKAPAMVSELLVAMDLRDGAAQELVLLSPDGHASALPFLKRLADGFYPQLTLAVVSAPEQQQAESLMPVVKGKRLIDGQATAYLCQNGSCHSPTTDPDELIRQLQD